MIDVAAIIAAIASIVGSCMTIVNHVKIQQVHVLVNSRLDSLIEILRQRTAERDSLQAEKDALNAHIIASTNRG